MLGHLTPSRIRVRGAFGRTSGRIPGHGQFPQSCGLQILVENLEALQMELPRLTVDLKRIRHGYLARRRLRAGVR